MWHEAATEKEVTKSMRSYSEPRNYIVKHIIKKNFQKIIDCVFLKDFMFNQTMLSFQFVFDLYYFVIFNLIRFPLQYILS